MVTRLFDFVQRRRTPLLLTAWFLASLWAASLAFVEEALEDLDSLRAQEWALAAEVEQKHRHAAHLRQWRDWIVEFEQTYGDFMLALPPTFDAAATPTALARASEEAGAVLVSVTPGNDREHEFHAERPYVVEAEGSYVQLGGFVDRIGALARVHTVSDISISRSSGDVLTMRAVVRAYRHLEIEAP